MLFAVVIQIVVVVQRAGKAFCGYANFHKKVGEPSVCCPKVLMVDVLSCEGACTVVILGAFCSYCVDKLFEEGVVKWWAWLVGGDFVLLLEDMP